MALTTKYPGHIVIAESPQNIVFGTCQIDSSFGEVKSASVKRTADKEELDNAKGDLLAAILRKPRFELTLKTLFTTDVTPPGIGERIAFPLVAVHGRILDVTIDWEDASGRMMSIEATSWDSFAGTEEAEHFDGMEWNPLTDTVAIGPTPVNVLPTIVSATLATNGSTLSIVFSEPVVTSFTAPGLTVTGSGTAAQPAHYYGGNATDTLLFNLVTVIGSDEVVTLAYVSAASPNGIQDLEGGGMLSTSGVAVLNHSTQP